MRLFLISFLMASAALPAAAVAQDSNDHPQRTERGDRADRAERPAATGGFRVRDQGGDRSFGMRAEPRPERAAPAQSVQSYQPPREMRVARPDAATLPAPSERRFGGMRPQYPYGRSDPAISGGWSDRAARAVSSNNGQAQPDGVRKYRNHGPRAVTTDGLPNEAASGGDGHQTWGRRHDENQRVGFDRQLRDQQERNLVRRSRLPGLPPGTTSTWGTNRYSGEAYRGVTRWGSDWRQDRRYDWRNWRQRNRSAFHLGIYYDPFGLGYQRLGAGWQLFPGYYQSDYWLSDPWQYRLPPAYGPYRWVRYWDDALLVNIYSGQVVDVIHDFFW